MAFLYKGVPIWIPNIEKAQVYPVKMDFHILSIEDIRLAQTLEFVHKIN
jgi:hypothetical protein